MGPTAQHSDGMAPDNELGMLPARGPIGLNMHPNDKVVQDLIPTASAPAEHLNFKQVDAHGAAGMYLNESTRSVSSCDIQEIFFDSECSAPVIPVTGSNS